MCRNKDNIKFKKVIIYYFSGTGNARNTAFWVGDEAKTQEVEIINIAKVQNQEIMPPEEDTLVGFIAPTHGFHFPQIMRDFIKRFPKVDKGNAFVANTRAGLRIGKLFIPGLSGVLHYWTSYTLRKKGYNIVGLLPVDLPSNWLFLHPAVKEKGTELIYQHIEPKVRCFAKTILEGKRSFRALYDIVQDILIAPIAIAYIFAGKYFFAKSFIASSDCDMCGLCKRACPVQAIREVNGRMFWTGKCESCMKCMNICPHEAIETAHGFVTIIIIITTLIIGYLTDRMTTISLFADWQWLQNGKIKLLILSILIFPFLFIGYHIMHRLMEFRLFERFFVFTSLSKYKFWGRYKSKNVKKSLDNK